MRRIAAVTVGRSDYGILRPVLERIVGDPDLELQLIVSGGHLSDEYGATVGEIEADGIAIAERVALPLSDDRPATVAAAIGHGVIGFAAAYERLRPDLLLVLGDRYEVLAAVAAAVPFTLPVAHIHGGELTEGAIDDGIRHAITKLSHLHFAATPDAARRLEQLGEEPWRITVSGAPGLDNLAQANGASGPEVADPFLLATWHPVTLEPADGDRQLGALLDALAAADLPVVFTHPNADPGRRAVVRAIEEFARTREDVHVHTSLGTRDFFGLLRRARAMVGNSSSGIIEAASFELPVVNVGSRQRGRLHGANVIDVEAETSAIRAAIERATSDEFRASLAGLMNPYGDGHAAKRIVERLVSAPLGRELLVKRFEDAS